MSSGRKTNCNHRVALPKETKVAEAGMDVGETTILEMARLYFKNFVEPQSEAWMHAFRRAGQVFPPDISADVAWKTCEMVQAMRCSRRSCFSFNSPTCAGCSQFMTEHERQLMGVLVATRCGRISEARTHAMLICEGNETGALITAAEHLASAMGERLQDAVSLKTGTAELSAQ